MLESLASMHFYTGLTLPLLHHGCEHSGGCYEAHAGQGFEPPPALFPGRRWWACRAPLCVGLALRQAAVQV